MTAAPRQACDPERRGRVRYLAGETGRVYVVESSPRPVVITYSSSGVVTTEHDENSEAVIASVRFSE